MSIRPIKTRKEYQIAFNRLESIFDARPGTSLGNERARQDSITTEIMEIVSGAEALGSGKDKDVKAYEIELAPGSLVDADGFLNIRPTDDRALASGSADTSQ